MLLADTLHSGNLMGKKKKKWLQRNNSGAGTLEKFRSGEAVDVGQLEVKQEIGDA